MKWINRKITLFIVMVIGFGQGLTAQDITQQVTANRKNDSVQINKPYLICISADGFRYDYADKYKAIKLLKLRRKGVQASMIPAFPSVTFSNHYTLATGMYPSHHGIVNNSFYDPKKQQFFIKNDPNTIKDSSWYGGVPIWVLAEQQKMLSAVFYWPGSESAIQGVRPTYWYHYNEKIPIDDRIEVVRQWLQLPEEKRPHLIHFYLPEVDMAGHYFGTDAEETEAAVKLVDDCTGKLEALTNELGLEADFVFVSDHGMVNVDYKNTIPLPVVIDTSKCIVLNGDALLQVYVKDKKDISILFKKLKDEAVDYDVYLSEETPEHWHYRSADNKEGRIGDIIIIPHLPKVFNLTDKPTSIGKHGFDNHLPEMQAVFYAWGPAFREGLSIMPFENVHVYPLMAKILGLSYAHPIDGDIKVLVPILK